MRKKIEFNKINSNKWDERTNVKNGNDSYLVAQNNSGIGIR